MRPIRRVIALALCALLSACSDDDPSADNGDERSPKDASRADEEADRDAGTAGKPSPKRPVEGGGREQEPVDDKDAAEARPEDASVERDAAMLPEFKLPDEGSEDVPYEPLAAVEPDLAALVHTSGQHIVFTTDDSGLFLLDVMSGDVHDLNPEREPIAATMPSPDGKVLLLSAADPARNGGVFLVRFTPDGFVPAREVAGFEDIPAVHAALPPSLASEPYWSRDRRFVALPRSSEPGELGIDVVDTWAGARHITIGGHPAISALTFSFGDAGWFLYSLKTADAHGDFYARLSAGGRSNTVMLEPKQHALGLNWQGKRLYYADASRALLRGFSRELETGDEIMFNAQVADEELLAFSAVHGNPWSVEALYRNQAGNRVLRRVEPNGRPGATLVSDPERDLVASVASTDGPVVAFYESSLGLRVEADGKRLLADGPDLQPDDFVELPFPLFTLHDELHMVMRAGGDLPECSPYCSPVTTVDIVLSIKGPFDCLDSKFDQGATVVALERGAGSLLLFERDSGNEADRAMPVHGGQLSCPTWSAEGGAFAYIEHATTQDSIHLIRWGSYPDAPVELHSSTVPIRSIELTSIPNP